MTLTRLLLPVTGRSPRVRGSRRSPSPRASRRRSIPACAGEPRRPQHSRRPQQVDPRVCGGADSNDMKRKPNRGRSPRVRGSRRHRSIQRPSRRSIPACAGEPPTTSSCARATRVDPRVCGGAPGGNVYGLQGSGRSPRVRGSLLSVLSLGGRRGSIPACAGEPVLRTTAGYAARVDPRVCGGASLRWSFLQPEEGRSPRVRGSPLFGVIWSYRSGSIPACAGEPGSGRGSADVHRVDPRVCGGARPSCQAGRMVRGRSPRVRGSPFARRSRTCREGSIRVCGGAAASPAYQPASEGRSPRVRGSPRI